MNPAFDEVLAAGSDAMLSAFDTTALRLGTASQNIEKDFWVCWTLDGLFNGLKEGEPRLLFKSGTSLSKGFGLINRFSEDIDVTVFRDDIGEPATIEELEALSGKKRRARLDAIKDACKAYINGPLRAELTPILGGRLQADGLDAQAARVEADDDDPDGQTLLIWYPATTPRSDYVRAAIKIEFGAKSALDPNREAPIKPYVDDDLPALDLTVPAVRTVDPGRTFWDKVVILHGLRRWFDKRGDAGAANACRINTMTCTGSPPHRSAPPPSPRRRLAPTALHTHGCSSTDRTSISRAPRPGRSHWRRMTR
jgi:hypothetical protein